MTNELLCIVEQGQIVNSNYASIWRKTLDNSFKSWFKEYTVHVSSVVEIFLRVTEVFAACLILRPNPKKLKIQCLWNARMTTIIWGSNQTHLPSVLFKPFRSHFFFYFLLFFSLSHCSAHSLHSLSSSSGGGGGGILFTANLGFLVFSQTVQKLQKRAA